MVWQFPTASLPPLLAALLEIALVVLLLRAGRGRPATVALALLLLVAACADAMVFVFSGFTGTYETAVAIAITHAFWVFGGFLWLCFGAMLLAERMRVPRALASFAAYLAPAAAIAAIGLWKPELVYDFSRFLSAPLVADAPPGSFPFSNPQALALVSGLLGLSRPALAATLAWWALRREETEEWSSILLVAFAAGGSYVVNVAYVALDVPLLQGGSLTSLGVATLVLDVVGACTILGLFALLLHEGARGRTQRRPLARIGAAFLLAMALAGIWIARGSFSDPFVFSTYLALAALPFPVIATYALLRHRLLGLDVKVRFAISRSTIAAAFVVVFFLASEGAQILFGAGNEWVGLAAAGMLVFALAPLQRAAERLAERAVPVGPAPAAEPVRARTAELYRRSVRFALRDGRIAPEEELHLFEVAEELGLTAGEAMRLRQEVEREVAGGAST